MKNIGIFLLLAGFLTAPAFAADKASQPKAKKSTTKSAPAQSAPQTAPAPIYTSPTSSGSGSGSGYGMAGCGLGSMAFGNQPGMIQVLAATTNNATYTQTFGISTGTSNCEPEPFKFSKSTTLFIIANRETLEKDAARGQGESLDHLSNVIGCSDPATFRTAMQTNYSEIFPLKTTPPDEVRVRMINVLKKDRTLAQSCNLPQG